MQYTNFHHQWGDYSNTVIHKALTEKGWGPLLNFATEVSVGTIILLLSADLPPPPDPQGQRDVPSSSWGECSAPHGM